MAVTDFKDQKSKNTKLESKSYGLKEKTRVNDISEIKISIFLAEIDLARNEQKLIRPYSTLMNNVKNSSRKVRVCYEEVLILYVRKKNQYSVRATFMPRYIPRVLRDSGRIAWSPAALRPLKFRRARACADIIWRAGRRRFFGFACAARVRRDARMLETLCYRQSAPVVIHSTFCNLPFLSALIYVE